MLPAVLLAALWVRALAQPAVQVADDEASLRSALSRGACVSVHLRGDVRLARGVTIVHANTTIRGGGLTLLPSVGVDEPVLFIAPDAHDVLVEDVALSTHTHRGAAFAVEVRGASRVRLVRVRVRGGVRVHGGWNHTLAHSDVSNAVGAGGGTCVNIVACGNATSLESCGSVVHDTLVHDCRANGGSPYSPGAQGILLGGSEGGDNCTVGVVVRNNNVTGVDEMGIRVNNDNYGPCVLNQVYLNKVQDWGQLSAAGGGDTTDSGCLYMYGHWFSPGNNFSYNLCIATNDTWGQNGMYLDDAATGNVVVGNIFVNCSRGSMIKLNGGAFNSFDSNLAVGGAGIGFGNCRGLRGTPAQRYTCENMGKWLQVLEGVNYEAGAWHAAWPWYTGWCTNTTVNGAACAPPGAPSDYECAVLSRGNAIRNLAGVWLSIASTNFTLQSAPGFPDNGTAACPQFVLDDGFNSIDWAAMGVYTTNQFVDAPGGDYTLLPNSSVYADMPTFVRVPFHAIGIGGSV